VSQQQAIIRSGADFGRAIAHARLQRGATQDMLAIDAGVSRTVLAKIEAGKTTILIDHLLRLVRRLGGTVTITFDDAQGKQTDG
jgi:HTH-type transcriptional regulator/antitoxin HipB